MQITFQGNHPSSCCLFDYIYLCDSFAARIRNIMLFYPYTCTEVYTFKPGTYNKIGQEGPRFGKGPRLENVYKTNGSCCKKYKQKRDNEVHGCRRISLCVNRCKTQYYPKFFQMHRIRCRPKNTTH